MIRLASTLDNLPRSKKQFINWVAMFNRHFERPPTVEQFAKRFPSANAFDHLADCIASGLLVRTGQSGCSRLCDLLTIADPLRAEFDRMLDSTNTHPVRQTAKRLRQLQRVILIAQVVREYPISSAPEIHRLSASLFGLSCSLKTIHRDLVALEALGFIERSRLPKFSAMDRGEPGNTQFFEMIDDAWPFPFPPASPELPA